MQSTKVRVAIATVRQECLMSAIETKASSGLQVSAMLFTTDSTADSAQVDPLNSVKTLIFEYEHVKPAFLTFADIIFAHAKIVGR